MINLNVGLEKKYLVYVFKILTAGKQTLLFFKVGISIYLGHAKS